MTVVGLRQNLCLVCSQASKFHFESSQVLVTSEFDKTREWRKNPADSK